MLLQVSYRLPVYLYHMKIYILFLQQQPGENPCTRTDFKYGHGMRSGCVQRFDNFFCNAGFLEEMLTEKFLGPDHAVSYDDECNVPSLMGMVLHCMEPKERTEFCIPK